MSSELSFENRIVAFVDILGFSKAVSDNENSPEALSRLYDLIRSYSSEHALKTIYRFSNIPTDLISKLVPVTVTQFSDSFVFSVNTENSAGCVFLVSILTALMEEAHSSGFLVRGGVSSGKLIHEENGVLMGPALINAYNLESKLAIYGRIILDDSAVQLLEVAETKLKLKFSQRDSYNISYDGFHEITFSSIIAGNFKNDPPQEKLNALKLRLGTLTELSTSHKNNVAIYMKYKYIISLLEKDIKEIDSARQFKT